MRTYHSKACAQVESRDCVDPRRVPKREGVREGKQMNCRGVLYPYRIREHADVRSWILQDLPSKADF